MKKPSLRRIAFNALIETTSNGAYANLAIKEAVSSLHNSDAKWVSALFYSTLENLIYIDKVIDCNIKSKLDKKIRAILRLGVCQLLFMNVPESAAVNESVKLTKEIGKSALSGYVNAVMRSVASKKDNPFEMPKDDLERISIQYSYPIQLVNMLSTDYGIEFTEEILKYKHEGMNFRLIKPFNESLSDDFQATIFENARNVKNGFDVTGNELFQNGNITVQSLSSMTVCHVLDAKPNTKVLDACSAPGGKTAYISEMMNNSGKIIASDLHEHRVKLTKNTLTRLNVHNAECIVMDATKLNEEFTEAFDSVLVDAPCSGLGVVGKTDIKYTKTVESIKELAVLQYSILDNCSKYVKAGGTLVYSTCTITKEENEKNVERFLKEHPDFKADISIEKYLPEKLKKRAVNGMIQIFPHLDDMEGFFIARFTRWT